MFVKKATEMDYFAAIEHSERREKCCYLCYEGILATCIDAFELKNKIIPYFMVTGFLYCYLLYHSSFGHSITLAFMF